MIESSPTISQATITQVDAAKRYGVSDRTIRQWEADGLIKGTKIRNLKLYSVSKLDELTGANG